VLAPSGGAGQAGRHLFKHTSLFKKRQAIFVVKNFYIM
jgi:hypothetical protein